MSLDVYLQTEPIDLGGAEPQVFTVYNANITHNLGRMAKEAGIYEALWRPEEVGIKTASQLTPILQEGIASLRADPGRFKKFNAVNGWGLYERFLPFVSEYLAACQEWPKANVYASR